MSRITYLFDWIKKVFEVPMFTGCKNASDPTLATTVQPSLVIIQRMSLSVKYHKSVYPFATRGIDKDTVRVAVSLSLVSGLTMSADCPSRVL